MPNAAKAAVLLAAVLAMQAAPAAEPATSIESAVSGSAPAEQDPTPPALDGAELFATHCAMCHRPADRARRLQSAADPNAAMTEMAAYLSRHGRSNADADAAIIHYLASIRSPAP